MDSFIKINNANNWLANIVTNPFLDDFNWICLFDSCFPLKYPPAISAE